METFNHNTYINVTEKYILTESYLNEDKSIEVLNEFSYDGWKKNFAFDEQSILIGTNHPLATYQRSVVFYNGIKDKKMIDLSAKIIMIWKEKILTHFNCYNLHPSSCCINSTVEK